MFQVAEAAVGGSEVHAPVDAEGPTLGELEPDAVAAAEGLAVSTGADAGGAPVDEGADVGVDVLLHAAARIARVITAVSSGILRTNVLSRRKAKGWRAG